MSPALITTASGATWQEVAADRQKYRDETIAAIEPKIPSLPAELPLNVTSIPKQILATEEISITETMPENLVALLAEGKLSATVVTKAFLRRAGLAQKLTNCITELLPEKALTRAAFLDAYLTEHKTPIGPLHGLPISAKEHISMEGLDLNAGFVSWVGCVGVEDAYILKILWAAGAVFYARTTQPQSLMHLETSSNLYGWVLICSVYSILRVLDSITCLAVNAIDNLYGDVLMTRSVTVNPFNTTLTSGGSSGGEGALIGIRGSCLGVGTDIGGSIRSPAANNGIYGFRPTSYRLPISGLAATMAGEEQIVPCIGPLSTSLEGVKLFMKTIIAAKPWLKEPSLLPFQWNDARGLWGKEGRKLKVAVLWEDEVVRPHPPVTRALEEIVEKLKVKGNVDVVKWKPYKHDLAWEIIANLYFCDGAVQEREAIESSGEPYRPLTNFIITNNPHVKMHTVTSMWAATSRREEYRSAYAELWNSTAISTSSTGTPEGMVDVILCPAIPSAAPKFDTARYWGYTSQWNLLDYPAVVFPVSKVGESDANAEKEKYEPRNEMDAYNWGLWEKHGAKGYMDAPLSLQVVGRRYEDEKVLEALEVVKRETGLPFVNYK